MLHSHGKAIAYQNGLENLKPNVDSSKTISQFCLPFSLFISSKLLGYSRDCFPFLLDWCSIYLLFYDFVLNRGTSWSLLFWVIA